MDSAQENLRRAAKALPGHTEGRVDVPFTDPQEVDAYLDIAERLFREALEYLDEKARDSRLHEIEGQKHHYHGKYLTSNSEDYLDPEDHALFEIVDKALGVDLAPPESHRAYVCDPEEIEFSLSHDNHGRLKRARSSLPDSGYEADHLETDEQLEDYEGDHLETDEHTVSHHLKDISFDVVTDNRY
ncbi:MAG: hypothetical protein ABEJ03_00910 [Candidatus Nanohaloarchaea archaeon]